MEDSIKKVIYLLLVDGQDTTSGRLGDLLGRSGTPPYGIYPSYSPTTNEDAFITWDVGDFENDNTQNGQRGFMDWTFTVWNRKVIGQIEPIRQRIYRLLQDYNDLATFSYVSNFNIVERGPIQFSERRNSYYATVVFSSRVHILAGNANDSITTYLLATNGFESPTFTVGVIDGQDGWACTGASNVISTDQAYAGTQSLKIASGGGTATRDLDTNTNGYSTATIEWWAYGIGGYCYIYSTEDEDGTDIETFGKAFYFRLHATSIAFNNYNVAGTSCAVSASTWNKYKVIINFQGKAGADWTGTCYVNDDLKFTDIVIGNTGGNGLGQIAIKASTGTQYIDNLTIYYESE